jgi:hypothetical protein
MSKFLKIGGGRPVRVQYVREVSSPKRSPMQNPTLRISEPGARESEPRFVRNRQQPLCIQDALSKVANDAVDVSSRDSFPCSDPPGYNYCHI